MPRHYKHYSNPVKVLWYLGLRAIFRCSSTHLGKSLKPYIFRLDASIRRLKPLLGKGCQTNSLPIGLNRISWKR
ncbi:MAG: hypothetical protein RLP02_12245 [Coleofasciculus sp. C2-GNP5-27]|uniref:hypothetical protein n=1 Tax=Coleofasciculus chthonoplastes TaxID=64178 RepID=UPI0012F99645|nr:hypothetical protein [Coleofasciculus chthonoplastes]